MFYTDYTRTELIGKSTACGGNWTAMLITGIKACAPELYEAMPDVSYDFITIGHLCNVICTDDELDYEDMLHDFMDMDVDHDYWLDCVRKAHNVCIDYRDCQMLAYLWMFKHICLDKELPVAQLRKTCKYLSTFEEYVRSKDGFLEPVEG